MSPFSKNGTGRESFSSTKLRQRILLTLVGGIPTAFAAVMGAYFEHKNSESKKLIAYQQAQLEAAYEKLDERLRHVAQRSAANKAVLDAFHSGPLSEASLRLLDDELTEDPDEPCLDDGCGGAGVGSAPPAPPTVRSKPSLPTPSKERVRRKYMEQREIVDM